MVKTNENDGDSMDISINQLSRTDFEKLYQFELQNRIFFEKMVPSRGDEYYEYGTFILRNEALLEEQHQGISYFYLIKNETGDILGRINLVDINEERVGHVGYRIGEEHNGKGFGNRALAMLLEEAAKLGIWQIKAKTTINNIASQRVLEKNGFSRILAGDENFVHFIWSKR